jgi:phosphatidylserine/phosphatidylglycerophosphate/cardiolipin synthase-like enzyme
MLTGLAGGMRTGATSAVSRTRIALVAVVLAGTFFAARPAAGLDRLCDPAFENCRTQLLDLINRETQGIDVSFWFMEDPRYLAAITAKWRAGVPVRLLIDPRASATYTLNAGILQGFVDAGVPMRMRVASGILHWKLMLFAGQGIVEFSGANYSDNAFKPVTPYMNYVDEAVLFIDDPAIVNTFMTKFDASWIDRTSFRDYANITTPLARHYPIFTQAAELNFPPGQSYATRAVALYTAEQTGIDVIMYRVTDRRHSDAMIAARARGVPVRIITDLKEYRSVAKLWHAWNIDRMWAAGIAMRVPAHAGMNHQKSVVLQGQRTVIFGSSNWTSPSDRSQQEHNLFTRSSWMLNWFIDQFDRKWYGTNPLSIAETKPFVPLPPDTPKNVAPKPLATAVARSVKLSWYGGPWAHTYDVYFGTTPTPPRVATNKSLGPSLTTGQYQGFWVSSLAADTTYYWKIVSKTAAGKTKSGAVWSFRTGS